jgi:hypothetical protein
MTTIFRNAMRLHFIYSDNTTATQRVRTFIY